MNKLKICTFNIKYNDTILKPLPLSIKNIIIARHLVALLLPQNADIYNIQNIKNPEMLQYLLNEIERITLSTNKLRNDCDDMDIEYAEEDEYFDEIKYNVILDVIKDMNKFDLSNITDTDIGYINTSGLGNYIALNDNNEEMRLSAMRYKYIYGYNSYYNGTCLTLIKKQMCINTVNLPNKENVDSVVTCFEYHNTNIININVNLNKTNIVGFLNTYENDTNIIISGNYDTKNIPEVSYYPYINDTYSDSRIKNKSVSNLKYKQKSNILLKNITTTQLNSMEKQCDYPVTIIEKEHNMYNLLVDSDNRQSEFMYVNDNFRQNLIKKCDNACKSTELLTSNIYSVVLNIPIINNTKFKTIYQDTGIDNFWDILCLIGCDGVHIDVFKKLGLDKIKYFCDFFWDIREKNYILKNDIIYQHEFYIHLVNIYNNSKNKDMFIIIIAILSTLSYYAMTLNSEIKNIAIIIPELFNSLVNSSISDVFNILYKNGKNTILIKSFRVFAKGNLKAVEILYNHASRQLDIHKNDTISAKILSILHGSDCDMVEKMVNQTIVTILGNKKIEILSKGYDNLLAELEIFAKNLLCGVDPYTCIIKLATYSNSNKDSSRVFVLLLFYLCSSSFSTNEILKLFFKHT